jgi:hypothetical protein
MKSKLAIALLLLVCYLDVTVLATKVSSSSVSSPDGVAVVKKHRRKRRQRYYRPRPKIERTSDPSGGGSDNLPSAGEPSAEPSEQPTMAAPPPVQSGPEIDTPGRGAPKKRSSAPKIKPPTVQIKPPTR